MWLYSQGNNNICQWLNVEDIYAPSINSYATLLFIWCNQLIKRIHSLQTELVMGLKSKSNREISGKQRLKGMSITTRPLAAVCFITLRGSEIIVGAAEWCRLICSGAHAAPQSRSSIFNSELTKRGIPLFCVVLEVMLHRLCCVWHGRRFQYIKTFMEGEHKTCMKHCSWR